MPSFSRRSMDKLDTCHPDLKALFKKVVEEYDCTVTEGHRDEATQNEYYESERSKLQWPESKHNKYPSMAVDVVPYPIIWPDKSKKDWERDLGRFYHFAGYVFGVARSMGIKLRWGGDWDSDKKFTDQSFHDLPHFELVE